ncbi:YSIRK-type signal peptide-containing protein [Limosilactobacillus fermentum]
MRRLSIGVVSVAVASGVFLFSSVALGPTAHATTNPEEARALQPVNQRHQWGSQCHDCGGFRAKPSRRCFQRRPRRVTAPVASSEASATRDAQPG